jgi:lysophospholipase L1-like esterase
MSGKRILTIFAALAFLLIAGRTDPANAQSWVASWTASAQGPWPVGNATAQPELKFALPSAETGASDQTFRMIVRPDVWGNRARIRFSNAFGTKPVTFDGVWIGLRSSGATLVPGTNRAVAFGGRQSVTIPPGKMAMSDPVALPWVKNPGDPMLADRKLAVSFHIAGDSGPMTWHAKALTTSYLSAPHGGAHGADQAEDAFPYSTTSWYFLDEVDMAAPGAKTVVAFGDSITDGTASTLNGDDRWPDVFARRVHAAFGDRYSVVNEGIGGNMVIGPPDYATKPFGGGPEALERLERDVISLPNVSSVIWLEGINDFGNAGAEPKAVADGVRDAVKRLRASVPGVKIFMATLTSSLHSTNGAYGGAAVEDKRRAYNDFIRTSGIFDGVIDFDAATIDPATGELKAGFQPNSTTGGPGDKLHPNRAGYAAMGRAIDLGLVFGKAAPKK